MPRSGHGAASLIPHLHAVIPLEPSHLIDPMSDDLPGDGEVLGASADDGD
jgi:hypothetical protein